MGMLLKYSFRKFASVRASCCRHLTIAAAASIYHVITLVFRHHLVTITRWITPIVGLYLYVHKHPASAPTTKNVNYPI
jgi:hypothetical protein